MSDQSRLCLGVNTVTKTVRGIVIDGFVFKDQGGSLSVKLLAPADGSTPVILHHAPRIGVLSGHEILVFCAHAVSDAHRWLSRHKLLEEHDIASADDWHFYGTFGGQKRAFISPSLDVLVIFNITSGAFESFVGCMVRQGRAYRYPTKRLGALLFGKIVMATAMRVGAPSSGGSLVT